MNASEQTREERDSELRRERRVIKEEFSDESAVSYEHPEDKKEAASRPPSRKPG